MEKLVYQGLTLLGVVVATGAGCSAEETRTDNGASGGATSSGGRSLGGATSLGGVASGGIPPSGGTTGLGGAAPSGGVATGGNPAFGGTQASGGVVSSGGTLATGGASVTGGTVSTGGTQSTGGASSTAGTTSMAGAPQAGGSSGAGGVLAAGGTSAVAGSGSATGGTSGGAGGSGGGSGFACSGFVPINANITNFLPWSTSGAWGAPGDLTGGSFVYPATGGFTATVDTAATDPNLHLVATLPAGGYTGFGLWFGPCVNGSAYSGITFSLGGALGGGTLDFQLQTSRNYPVDTTNAKGACLGTWSSGCANNHTALTVAATPALTNVAWALLIGGLPITPADPRELLGMQWQVNCPATATAGCAVDLTLDNVAFY